MHNQPREVLLTKCTFGNDFAQAKSGWSTKTKVQSDNKMIYQLRMESFNHRSGLPTYVARAIHEDGSYETYWAHNINVILDWFRSFENDTRTVFEVEGNK